MKSLKNILSFILIIALAVLPACSASYDGEDGSSPPLFSGETSFDGEDLGDQSGNNYTEIVENAFISAAQKPNSYFSIDANTSSYPNLRSLINNGYTIDKNAVRVEEMLNYFNYDYAKPEGDEILSLTSSVFDNPYNPETKLLTVGLAAREVEFTSQRNNLVFLIDVSGSMFGADRLGLVQQAFMMLAENLGDDDRVSIVTYAGSDRVALEGAYGRDKANIMAVIEDLSAGGSTAGADGINTAYALAERYFIQGGNNRVILATDGDFNVGVSGTSQLEKLIKNKRESGVYLSVFGVGYGNYQAEKMEALALNGNGTYSFLDSVAEARRALVEQIGGTILTVAKDVKAGITFNPDYIDSYRLIGYENKLMSEDEFNDSAKDAGELGSGHTVTVVYELKLVENASLTEGNIADVTVRYKPTENSGGLSSESSELKMSVEAADYHSAMTQNDAFVASVVEFALILRDSDYKANADLNALITRLDDLDLSSDQFKDEFRSLVKKYRNNTEN
ncbi:MAG: von Willebrand factor type A domain-containing protein [Clostridia bacterium]|nr:von Willebrand factor type A domain-containing protein [Clostridia bacterium]